MDFIGANELNAKLSFQCKFFNIAKKYKETYSDFLTILKFKIFANIEILPFYV